MGGRQRDVDGWCGVGPQNHLEPRSLSNACGGVSFTLRPRKSTSWSPFRDSPGCTDRSGRGPCGPKS